MTVEKTCRNCRHIRVFLDVWECDECPARDGYKRKGLPYIFNPDAPDDACRRWGRRKDENK